MRVVLPECVVVHPLVLLATVDHYNRVAKDTNKRVCGILLGTTFKGKVDVTNAYAGIANTIAITIAITITRRHPHRDVVQFLSRRIPKTQMYGFWTITSMRTCMPCSVKSMVRQRPTTITITITITIPITITTV